MLRHTDVRALIPPRHAVKVQGGLLGEHLADLTVVLDPRPVDGGFSDRLSPARDAAWSVQFQVEGAG